MGPEDAREFIRYLASQAHLQKIHFLWRPFLRDPDDDMVLELAVAARCPYIVTHNLADFRRTAELGVQAISPKTLLDMIRSTS